MIELSDFNSAEHFTMRTRCCFGLTFGEAYSFWPIPFKDEKTKESTK
jgi:hypothetical protein